MILLFSLEEAGLQPPFFLQRRFILKCKRSGEEAILTERATAWSGAAARRRFWRR